MLWCPSNGTGFDSTNHPGWQRQQEAWNRGDRYWFDAWGERREFRVLPEHRHFTPESSHGYAREQEHLELREEVSRLKNSIAKLQSKRRKGRR